MIGKTISHYQIVGTLGSGGMSVVYKAQDMRLGRFVALKFLLEKLCRRREALEQFRQEARTASALNHPAVCTIHDIDQHRDRPFIVMEYLEGETLRDKMRKRRLTLEESLTFGVQVAGALSQAHTTGIVHRDISPANLFVTLDGRVKLLDFGIAQLTSKGGRAGAQLTKSRKRIVTGTVHYMSPEQALGQQVDARSDIFSVGVVLYEMLTGRRPFDGDNLPAVLAEIKRATPKPMARVSSNIPAPLHDVVKRCLMKCPEHRYPNAAELRDDLESAATGLSLARKTQMNSSAVSRFNE